MAGPAPDRRRPLGQPQPGLSQAEARLEWLGALVALLWALVVLVWGLGFGQTAGLNGILFLIFAVALPVAMLGLLVLLLRTLRGLRGDAAALAAQVQALRQTEAREVAARTVRAEEAARGGPGFASRRDPAQSQVSADGKVALVAPRLAAGEEQTALALATPTDVEPKPVDVADFIRAVQFPESAEDVEGFAALRRVLADRTTSKLIRAAQDVLTLLAQDGIYMDDLVPDRARPDLWRRFAAGERGRPVAALGGIRDRSCLALTGQKMREDPVFRDAAHHFLRSFDRGFAEIEPRCSDADISDLSDTRTARAFMLIGRVAGTFD